jgi:predicted RNA-binding protein with RPS1 domain
MKRFSLICSASFFVALVEQLWDVSAYAPRSFPTTSRIQRSTLQSTSLVPEISLEGCERTQVEEPCFWKPTWSKSLWQRRIHLDDLKVGQRLKGTIVQELLDGKTGPKLFLEVGAGRTDSDGKWIIVFAMTRLSRAKDSVIRKRTSRLKTKESIDVWISRVQKECGRLEVCLSKEELEKYAATPKRQVTSLQEGEEVLGKVVRVEKYGVFIDAGANRLGLLHILKVRKLYGKFIDGEKGLIEAGLERGAKVRLCVESVEKRRLSLDFTDDVKRESTSALEATSAESKTLPLIENRYTKSETEEKSDFPQLLTTMPVDADVLDEQEYQDDGDGDYDEDRDIEDSLGLGFY